MLVDIVDAFRTGHTSPTQCLEHYLDRIAGRDSLIRAWVEVDIESARGAAAAATSRWRDGKPLSDLDGIPVAVKDIIDIAGKVTGLGMEGWQQEPADVDAAIVAQLRELGAVVLGKTVTTPFACFEPPPTRHPLRTHCTPGGSSSGSAAAVADRQVAWALGSQTGGSITRPAAYCGIVGFKPSHGRLPLSGVFPISPRLDHLGFLCPDARSAAAIWRTLTGESSSVSSAPRVAVLSEVGHDRVDSQLLSVLADSVHRIAESGGNVEPQRFPLQWDSLLQVHGTIMAAEAWQTHEPWFGAREADYPVRVAELIRRGREVSATQYEAATAEQAAMARQVYQWLSQGGWDAIVMLSTPTTAPSDRATTGDPSFNSPWSLLGLPTLTIPVGCASDGLPVGLQWIGAPGADAQLLGLGQWCESRGILRR